MTTLVGSYPTEWSSTELQYWMVSEFREEWNIIEDILRENEIVDGRTLFGNIDKLEVDESLNDFVPLLIHAVEHLRNFANCRNFCKALQLQHVEKTNINEDESLNFEPVIDEKMVQSTTDFLYSKLVRETLPRKYDAVGTVSACGDVIKSSNLERNCTSCCNEVSCTAFTECEHTYCKQCLRKIFDTAMSGNVELPVKCCKVKNIPIDIIANVTTSIELEEYRKRIESQSQNFVSRLFCPNQECSHPIMIGVFETLVPPNIECPKCLCMICTDCRNIDHQGECSKEENADVIKDNNWQQCPSCAIGIERSHGCNQMYCTSCHTKFCYSCGHEWNESEKCSCSDALDTMHQAFRGNRNYQRHHYERYIHDDDDDDDECEHGELFKREFRNPKTQSGVLRECSHCDNRITTYAWECRNCKNYFCINCSRHFEKLNR